ncbi:hypothetical protein IKE80_00355 [Candidatus Saccharibacteria bacterium]|nr:hypothetical protein [Candidatus Saccharibacteria bacterium]
MNKKPVNKLNKKISLWPIIIIGGFLVILTISLIQIENDKNKHIQAERAECMSTDLNYQFNESKGKCERINYASEQACVSSTAGKIYTKPSDISDEYTLYSSNYTIPTYSSSTAYYYIDCHHDGDWSTTKITEKTTPDYVSHYAWRQQERDNTSPASRYTCVDVTSYDYDWDNDMYCASPNGTHFYTNYEGAEALMQADAYDQMMESYEDYIDYGSEYEEMP